MNKISFYLFLAALLAACHKPAPEPPDDPTDTVLPVRWKAPLSADTMRRQAEVQYVWGNNIIYDIVQFGLGTSVEMRDSSGNRVWAVDGFSASHKGFMEPGHILGIKDNTIVHDEESTACIDNRTGALIWHSSVKSIQTNASSLASVIDDYVYAVHNSYGPASRSLVRTHYLNGRWDTLVTFPGKYDDYVANMAPPALWINPHGDSILIIRNHERYTGPNTTNGQTQQVSLYAFNLRTRQFEWSRHNIDPEGAVTLNPLLVEQNRLYLNCQHTLRCLDLLSGEDIWKGNFRNSILRSTLVLYQDMLILQTEESGLWGLDKHSGAIVWNNPNTYGHHPFLRCFNGILYGTATGYYSFYAIRAATGEWIWLVPSPNHSPQRPDASFYNAGIAIDTTRRVLYSADNYFLMGIKLPE
ncbi:MAG: PQQ-like beta-propeller repeat protein [Saprospiraceae bacterium]|nr:PQQ-like beta-propeller repeat protein [Saprospiraceae bacterium]